MLIAVVGATWVVTLLELAVTTGAHAAVPVLGTLPQGLPGFSLPLIGASDITPMLLGRLAVALISRVRHEVLLFSTFSSVQPIKSMT